MEKKTEKAIEFHEHKFVKKADEAMGDRFQNKYPVRIYYSLYKIEQNLKTLQLCRRFIAHRHPLIYDDRKEKSTITTEEYLRYHIENYFLRITGYKDQILELFANVYCIEIEKNIGFEKNLRKKLTEKQLKQLTEIIETVNKLLSKVKPIRNKIAHEGYFHDDDLGLIHGMDYYLKRDGKKSKFKQEDLTSLITSTIMENIMEMIENEKSLATNFFQILDVLYEPFISRIEKIKE